MSHASHAVHVLGVTCGDPGGIGLECFLKALEDSEIHHRAALVLFAAPELLDLHCAILQRRGHRLASREAWTPCLKRPTTPGLYLVTLEAPDHPPTQGVFDRKWGAVSRAALETAITYAMDGMLDGVVTLPICKESLLETQPSYPGQTEMFADLTQTTRYAMMLAGPTLRVVLVTTHIPLRDVANSLTIDDITEKITLTAECLRDDFNIQNPVIAVCGLNPHAGEAGHMGDEESRVILPAIEKAKALGFDIRGPLPADALFVPGRFEAMDAVICMYHDQALIPLKLLHFDEAVNTTLGIPFVRTSPDHGVGYDIAGKDKARAGSTRAALEFALQRCGNRD